MAATALTLCVLYAVAVLGMGGVVQRRRTGVDPWVRAATSTEQLANLLVLAAWLLDLLGPALVLGDVVEPWFDEPWGHVAGIVICGMSLAAGVAAQQAMGASWRTGIDPEHPAALVKSGLFGLVRNPVYTSMIGISLGTWLLAPTAAGALGFAACVVALEVQTRWVEEPHLRALHGSAYERYAARVGRFVPGVGRIPAP